MIMEEMDTPLITPEGEKRQALLLSCFSLPVEQQDYLAYLLARHILTIRHPPEECTLIDATIQSTLRRTVDLYKRFSGPHYKTFLSTSFEWMLPYIEFDARVFIGVGDRDGCPFMICVDTMPADELGIATVCNAIRTATGEASTLVLQ